MVEYIFVAVYTHKSIKQSIYADTQESALDKASRLIRFLPRKNLRQIKLVEMGEVQNVG